VLPEDKFMKDVEASLKSKFASKPHVIEKNMKALERGIKEVKST
jgi:pyruvate ferredoxin oxidoreductase gamma subunit